MLFVFWLAANVFGNFILFFFFFFTLYDIIILVKKMLVHHECRDHLL